MTNQDAREILVDIHDHGVFIEDATDQEAVRHAITMLERVEMLERVLEVLAENAPNPPVIASVAAVYRLELWAKVALKYLRTGEEW